MGQGNEGKETSEEIKKIIIFFIAVIVIIYLDVCWMLTN